MVSIIIPSYNSSCFIRDSLDSVITQSYQDWELLIVDDCSRDNTPEIIRYYSEKDKRIKPIYLTNNVGAAEARNIALRKASGQYIAFLDSDDLWLPQKLERQLIFMRRLDIAFSFTAYDRITEDGKRKINTIHIPHEISYNKYLRNTIIGTLTVMIDRNKTGYFEMPDIRSSHDMALWLDIMKRGIKAYGVKEVLAQYRVVSTSNTAKKIKAASDVWKVYRSIEELGLISSCYNFTGYAFNAILKRLK